MSTTNDQQGSPPRPLLELGRLAAYRARNWDRSEQFFARCLAVIPTDGPATVFQQCPQFLRNTSLPADWNDG
jgi:hypothetical protein